MAITSFYSLAEAGYAAYGKEMEKRLNVVPLDWNDVGGNERACWEAAARQMVAEVATLRSPPTPAASAA